MRQSERILAARLALALVDNETVRCPGDKCNGTFHAGSNAFQVRCSSCDYTVTLYVATKEATIIERQRSGKGNPRTEARQTNEGGGVSKAKSPDPRDEARKEEMARRFLFPQLRSGSGGAGRDLDKRKTQQRSRVSKRQRKA